MSGPVAAAAAAFTPEVRRRLDDLHRAPEFRGVIAAADAREFATTLGVAVTELMARLLPFAAAYAKPPISGFHVGAIARGMAQGDLYYGANLEFAGEALSAVVHAEQSAVMNAWMSGERGVDAIAVTAAPCGYCRQFLQELTSAEALMLHLPDETAPLADLLPAAFGPRNLAIERRLMAEDDQRLTIDAGDELALAALDAANASYAPYSHSYGGVAVRTADGAIAAGRYAENAAFSPSMSPLQAALSQLNLRGRTFDTIEDAVLVHVDSTHTSVTRTLLAAITPTPLRLIAARNVR